MQIEKRLVILKIILVSILVALTSFVFFWLGRTLYDTKSNEAIAVNDRICVVIDAGHGGNDPGASVDNVSEKALNLEVSKKIADFLKLYDVDVFLTREDDKLLCQDSSKHKKREDLLNRVKFVKKFDDPLFISIHMNKFAESKYRGLQVFYSPNNHHSEALALVVQSNNKELLDPQNTRNVKKATDSIYVLDRLQCPAILIECGFLSNFEDLSKLTDSEYQNKLAFVIANSIIEYIKL